MEDVCDTFYLKSLFGKLFVNVVLVGGRMKVPYYYSEWFTIFGLIGMERDVLVF